MNQPRIKLINEIMNLTNKIMLSIDLTEKNSVPLMNICKIVDNILYALLTNRI